jgi:hypothetical protein
MFPILKDRFVHYLLAKDGFITVKYKAAFSNGFWNFSDNTVFEFVVHFI